MAPDQYLLERLCHEALLLSGAFQDAEDRSAPGNVSRYPDNVSRHLAAALLAMVLDSRYAVVHLEGLCLLGDPRRPGISWCSLRSHCRPAANADAVPGDLSPAAKARITSGRGLFCDVRSLDIVDLPFMGGVPDTGGRRVATDASRHRDHRCFPGRDLR